MATDRYPRNWITGTSISRDHVFLNRCRFCVNFDLSNWSELSRWQRDRPSKVMFRYQRSESSLQLEYILFSIRTEDHLCLLFKFYLVQNSEGWELKWNIIPLDWYQISSTENTNFPCSCPFSEESDVPDLNLSYIVSGGENSWSTKKR